MRFGPMMISRSLAMAFTLAAIWPFMLWFGDFRVMLASILLQSVLTVLGSHLLAERRYRLRFDRAVIRRSLAFGWPLLINNLLLFGVFNGDRLIVGREIGILELGIFSMGMTLTLTPSLVLEKSTQNFFLPLISSADRSSAAGEARFRQLATVCFQVNLIFGTLLACGALLFGPALVRLLLDTKYAALGALLTWLAVMQGLRIFKGGPAIMALSRGRTANAMVANFVRIGTLPAAWWIATTTGNLALMILVDILGEAAGFVVAMLVLRWRIGLSLRGLAPSALASLACMAAILLASHPEGPVFPAATAVALALLLLTVLTMPELWRYLLRRYLKPRR